MTPLSALLQTYRSAAASEREKGTYFEELMLSYPHLDERIRCTYAQNSKATNKNALYDSYIRAIRWASDRVGQSGVIGFVTNAGFVEANTADGLRQCLANEFSSIYVFHLRGNQRTAGEQSRKEGGKVFGSGSRAPIAITLLVKNPHATQHGQIYFHDIGDYLSREDKLNKISNFASVAGITAAQGWQSITPDDHGDWLRQRNNSFGEFIVIGNKEDKATRSLFNNYSRGLETGRDAWVFNANQTKLRANMVRMIEFYNAEVTRFNNAHSDLNRKTRAALVDGFINTNPKHISWTSSLKSELAKTKIIQFKNSSIVQSLYRPFSKQWVYYDSEVIHRVGQMPRIFPSAEATNLLICFPNKGEDRIFSVVITDRIPDLHLIHGGQCFPLYLYAIEGAQEEDTEGRPDGRKQQLDIFPDENGDLFEAAAAQPVAPAYKRRDAITDEGLSHFLSAYPGEAISKEDVFY